MIKSKCIRKEIFIVMFDKKEKLAKKYFDAKNYQEAEELYKSLIAENNKNPDSFYNLAYINYKKGDFANAEMLLNASIEIGGNLDTLKLLARIKEVQKNYFDSTVMYEQVLLLEENEANYEKLGKMYIILELWDEMINLTKKYIQKFPSINAYRRLFLVYLNLNKQNELKKLVEEIKEKFNNQGVAINLLAMYKEFIEKDFDNAILLYKKAIKLGSYTAYYDLALCYKNQKNYNEALKTANRGMNFYPNKICLTKLISEICFCQKQMRKGYKYYLQRGTDKEADFLNNRWDGKIYKDKTVLVYCDITEINSIKFLRYITPLKNYFKNIIVACSDNLLSLLKYNKINSISYKHIYKQPYDKYVFLSELPFYLNIGFDNIPQYKLKSEKKEIKDKIKIGMLWQTTTDNFDSINNYTINPVIYFKDLIRNDSIQIYSFQKNDLFNTIETFPNIIDISEDLTTVSDYAEYINSMDLIIAPDSLVLQIAGALNSPCFGILFNRNAWYWFDNTKKTEWYKSVELFKLSDNNDYIKISKEITERIKNGKY